MVAWYQRGGDCGQQRRRAATAPEGGRLASGEGGVVGSSCGGCHTIDGDCSNNGASNGSTFQGFNPDVSCGGVGEGAGPAQPGTAAERVSARPYWGRIRGPSNARYVTQPGSGPGFPFGGDVEEPTRKGSLRASDSQHLLGQGVGSLPVMPRATREDAVGGCEGLRRLRAAR